LARDSAAEKRGLQSATSIHVAFAEESSIQVIIDDFSRHRESPLTHKNHALTPGVVWMPSERGMCFDAVCS